MFSESVSILEDWFLGCSSPSSLSPTVPYPPLNISHKVIHLSQRAAAELHNVEGRRRSSRQARDVLIIDEEQQETQPNGMNISVAVATTHMPVNTTHNTTEGVASTGDHTEEAEPQSYWLDPTETTPADRDEEFVNAVVPEYEDSNDLGSAIGEPSDPPVLPTRLPPILLELCWLPPRPPTSYDGFNIYIFRDGKHYSSWSDHQGVPRTTAGSTNKFSADHGPTKTS